MTDRRGALALVVVVWSGAVGVGVVPGHEERRAAGPEATVRSC